MVVVTSEDGNIVKLKRGRRISVADFLLLKEVANKGLN